jgi:hypothetical protein
MRLKSLVLTASLALLICACGANSKEAESVTSSEVTEETKAVEESSDNSAAAGAINTKSVTTQVSTVASKESISFETVDETIYVQGDNVNLRSKPDSTSEKITAFNKGEELKRIGRSEKWSKVMYKDKEAYISSEFVSTQKPKVEETQAQSQVSDGAEIGLNPSWKYADFSKINSGKAKMYKASGNRKNKVVCVNAGHGTSGGSSVKTLSHPDSTPKVTGGTTAAGQVTSIAVSGGMTFADGTSEASVTLAMAKVLKNELLSRGYDVLMIRESDDVQLDNIARTVIANNNADCHLALHWDSTSSNKGAFYMSVPNVASYRAMEPVASNWQKHHRLGDSVISGLRGVGTKIFSNGSLEMDLTQTSYSTIPSIDIELGDKASSHDESVLKNHAKGIADGLDAFFAQ